MVMSTKGYLTSIRNKRLRVQLSNCRLGSHKLQSQTARWLKDKVRAEELKVCKACGNADEDEAHVLLQCPCYDKVRKWFEMSVITIVLGPCLPEQTSKELQILCPVA